MVRPTGRLIQVYLLLSSVLNAAASNDSQPLNIHIVPHSHCDPGWLDSFEAYYGTQVHTILSAVTNALVDYPERRFVWAEISFFMRWYEVQTDETKAQVRALVHSRQLEFVGGGWSQNDEANPSYDAIISQITEGHEYLLSLFGVKPRIAWQIDPFGHSAATATVAALAGYDALVINRIEHTVKDALKARAAMEFVWQPYLPSPATASWGDVTSQIPAYSNASIFTHVLHKHYSAPKQFDWENGESISLTPSNVASRAEVFVDELRSRAAAYRTSHLLVPFGDDFKFQRADVQFNNMDMLIEYINGHNAAGNFQSVTIAYSTLSEYFDSVWRESNGLAHPWGPHAPKEPQGSAGVIIPMPILKADSLEDGGVDFFPYADNQDSFWTGYYTSRPLLKQAIRRTYSTLKAAEGMLALMRPWANAWQSVASGGIQRQDAVANASGIPPLSQVLPEGAPEVRYTAGQLLAYSAQPYAKYSWMSAFQRLEQVRLDLALCLHHDAITGTSRRNVVEDYLGRMASGARAALGVLSDLVSLTLGGLPRSLKRHAAFPETLTRLISGLQGEYPSDAPTLEPAPLTHVPHVLPVSPRAVIYLHDRAGAGKIDRRTAAHPIVVYNPVSWARQSVVTVMVDVGSQATAHDCRGSTWPFALVSDDEGSAVPSQWLAVVEEARTATAVGQLVRNGSYFALQGRRVRPIAPQQDVDVSWAATGTRYELAFLVDLPAYSLATYFVTVGWSAVGGDGRSRPSLGPCGVMPSSLRDIGALGASTVVFADGLPPVSQAAAVADLSSYTRLAVAEKDGSTEMIRLENACLAVDVSPVTGLLSGVTYKQVSGSRNAKDSSQMIRLQQQFGVYKTRQSGAYMFRPVSAPVILRQDDTATVTVVTSPVESSEGGRSGGLLQMVKVVGPKFSQTIRLTDTLGWYTGRTRGMSAESLGALCADPLVPDSAVDFQPTVQAGSNEEIVVLMTTQIDPRTDTESNSPNLRDNIISTQPAKFFARRPTNTSDGPVCGRLVPSGWWTGDSLGLLRRQPAPVHVPDNGVSRHFYPLNVLSRVAGPVADSLSAWVTIFSSQPFGTTTRLQEGGSRMEIMLARHLLQDDGRGLSSGVEDNTVLTARLLLTVAAGYDAPCGSDGRAKPRAGAAVTGVDVSHQDWLWTWATRSTAHHQPLVSFHADLADLYVEASAMRLADVQKNQEPKAASQQVLPPLDAGTHVVPVSLVAAEGAVPIDMWLSRYDTRYRAFEGRPWAFQAGRREDAYPRDLSAACSDTNRGMESVCSAVGSTPSRTSVAPWLHVLSLHVRDAVTDDVVLRLQNFGGPASVVDLNGMLSGGTCHDEHAACSPLIITAARSRTITLNHHEAYIAGHIDTLTHRHRLRFPVQPPGGLDAAVKLHPLAIAPVVTLLRADADNVRAAIAAFLAAMSGSETAAARLKVGSARTGDDSKQNSEEDGVFLSDAALEKVQGNGRKLLQLNDDTNQRAGLDRRREMFGKQLHNKDLPGNRRPQGAPPVVNRALPSAKHPTILPGKLSVGQNGPLELHRAKGVVRNPFKIEPPAPHEAKLPVVNERRDLLRSIAAANANQQSDNPSTSMLEGGRRPEGVDIAGVLNTDLEHVALLPMTIRSFVIGIDADLTAMKAILDAAFDARSAAAQPIAPPPVNERLARMTVVPAPPIVVHAVTGQPPPSSFPVTGHEESHELIAMIQALVTDGKEREAMLSRITAGKELTEKQRHRLESLNRKAMRHHDQARPAAVDDILKKIMDQRNVTDTSAAGGAEQPTERQRVAEQVSRELVPEDPWKSEVVPPEKLLPLLNVLKGPRIPGGNAPIVFDFGLDGRPSPQDDDFGLWSIVVLLIRASLYMSLLGAILLILFYWHRRGRRSSSHPILPSHASRAMDNSFSNGAGHTWLDSLAKTLSFRNSSIKRVVHPTKIV